MEELIDFTGGGLLQQRKRDVRLPPFWTEKPASWFALAEARFRSSGVVLEQHRFDLLVGSLNMTSIGQVIDLVENPVQCIYCANIVSTTRAPDLYSGDLES